MVEIVQCGQCTRHMRTVDENIRRVFKAVGLSADEQEAVVSDYLKHYHNRGHRTTAEAEGGTE